MQHSKLYKCNTLNCTTRNPVHTEQLKPKLTQSTIFSPICLVILECLMRWWRLLPCRMLHFVYWLCITHLRRILLLSSTRYSNDSQCIHRPTLSYGPLLFIRYSHSLGAGRFGVWSPVIAHPSIPRQWPTQPCFTMGMAFTTDPHLAQNLNMGRTIYYLSTPPVPAWLVT